MSTDFTPSEIERQLQNEWAEQQPFAVKEDLSQEKYYCLSMLPYPSGELHMGHVRNYTIGDVISRYQHMLGKNVLQPMGWDAFGLPAENAAIKNQLPPADWTEKNIKRMRKQLQQLGFAIDWKREISTCHSSYYRWEQWLFTRLFKKGLVYKKNAVVNWDPVDNTVLANEQVIDGKGWRSGAPVERKEIPQWFFKITDYAEELLNGLDSLNGWPDQVKSMQRNWIGRSEGTTVHFTIFKKPKKTIQIFTTRPDTLMGVTYLGIALEHPLAKAVADENPDVAKFIKKAKKNAVSEAELAQQEKLGVFSGYSAIHPITRKHIPIWITNFVLMEYGTGAVMSVPAHDQRDFEFATQYKLPIQQVIQPTKQVDYDLTKQAYTGEGTLINSGEFDGLKSKKAKKEITKLLTEKGVGESTTQYRLRDWGISRQRYWGTPIPIIYCKSCGPVAVPDSDLPVELPVDLVPNGQESPLKTSPDFYKVKCPNCGKASKRETDTMDTFVESSWYYARYCCFDQDQCMLDDRAKYWTPVDQYIGGIEHAVMHLLYARFIHKVLRDEGLTNSSEPFCNLLTQGMVLKDGAKMSKSKGNTVSPLPLIKKYGADTVRFFIIFAAPPEQDLEWSDAGVDGAFRYLKKIHAYVTANQDWLRNMQSQPSKPNLLYEEKSLQDAHRELHLLLQQANDDMQRQQLNTVASASMKMFNVISKIQMTDQESCLLIHEGISILLRTLSPIAPHLTQYWWDQLHFDGSIFDSTWPKVNPRALISDEIELMIQVNGKLRGKITVKTDEDEDKIKQLAKEEPKVLPFIADKTVKKIILVPKRLINIVV